MRTSTGAIVTACMLSAALLVAGCGGGKGTESSGEIFLEPAAAKGPDPFTDSTVTATAEPSPVARTPQPARTGRTGPQQLSGGTPGLYGGTPGSGSCDVRRQIDHLTSDASRGRAFAQASGITRDSIPGYLRGLTSVVLRADTRVTNHGFRDGRGTGYQSVLQAGTAVLVDRHGVPRVRCACGNPLTPAADVRGDPATSGRTWSGYRPDRVVVVAPTTQVITNITIINNVDNTWIERPTGHRGHDRDHVLPRPKPVPPTAVPHPHPHDSGSPGDHDGFPTDGSTSPSGRPTSPEGPPTDCATHGPADCPTATATPTPSHPTTDPGHTPASPASPEEPGAPDSGTEPEPSPKSPDAPDSPAASRSPEETGPETVPESPDLPDGGGLIPNDPHTTDSVFGSPTDVFAG
ncbi:DUF6777 domain-containing protein [Streptomyces bicolor]|uniref:DUF6777 domain-containing protein n=1 Tax=Streptomyces bicolor TaxID=66874 RepID=UPI0004E1186E|nr:DUF6777 domain-containing protein [Streptomyces bicolor]